MEEKPPTKHESSAEAEHAPEPRHVEPAPTVAVAGVYTHRPVYKPTTDSVVWQKLKGHPPLGAELIILTRSAIASCDGDPLEVVQKVISDLPEAVRAKCETFDDADPVEISRRVERHLPRRYHLRSKMNARRKALREAHPDIEHVQGNTWRGRSYADLDRFAADMEAMHRANGDLLDQYDPGETPGQPGLTKKVLLTILRGLGYPKPENLYRPADREPWTIPKARPK
jgi:hypothetical protein